MRCAVINIFNWAGFQIADNLLTAGERVDGIGAAESDSQKYLELFFGRNANLTISQQLDPAVAYDVMFVMGDLKTGIICFNQAKKTFELGKHEKDVCDGEITIHTPLIVGEWMPMTEQGVYQNRQILPFSSEKFKNCIPIESLQQCLMQMLHVSHLPEQLVIHSRNSPEINLQKRENIFISRHKDVQNIKHHILEHYLRHTAYFQL